MYQDTIAAIATPVGHGGIGIVRLSGGEACAIARRIFSGRLRRRRLTYGHIVDPADGQVVDEVLIAYMAAPHTYTREDVVEINCHGGPLPLQRILELTLRCGARLAQPGEFTLRAFLNGRLDLAQAEAVLDVIQAGTSTSLKLAMDGLQGRLSRSVQQLRQRLLRSLAYLTATIDFPEDEVTEEETIAPLTEALEHLHALLATADTGIVYRQGVRTAIVGRPNVGKSSLLNCLLGQNRAIVTPVPGTTRDTLEEVVNLQGVPFVLVDTAGMVDSPDLVERLGVERSRRASAQADFVLLVVDLSQPLADADHETARFLADKKVLIAANKADLPQMASPEELSQPYVAVSALTGQGLEVLEERMVSAVIKGDVVASQEPLVTNPRHKDALARSQGHLAATLEGAKSGLPTELVVIDLTAAVNALGEITGETVKEDLLETIFSQFCIGK
ncbi:MAG: tRNA uridine-5-carboxymethylaminomethyl(34) synthesis GTPase MnmE [Chloroflexi bacterium]|nr:tRNA uridine-5-carboxymethylaminomethyl(34) synthesis GTPase MnmE [Chloroflexota bacterium]